MNFKEWLLISEIAEPVRPLNKVTLRHIVKDGSTWRSRNVREYRFKTTKGNEIKLHFEKLNDEKNVYDVMFYVNNTQYDNASGGDPEILGNVLWLMKKKADQLKADVLTFTAQKGDGDIKIIRNMDINRFKPLALQELAKIRNIITAYEVKMVKPKADVFIRLGRPVPPDYPDLDKDKYLKILSAYESQIDSVGELVTNTTHLFQDLSRLNIDASGFINAMKRLWEAQESNTEHGFHRHRNRREFVWEKLMNRYFTDWLIEKSGVKFRLSRKSPLSEKTLYHGTLVDYENSIRQYGLQGGWHGPLGSFVSQYYDSEEYGEPSEEDEVVFATDKAELGKAVNAMVHHISQKLKKDFHDVTDNDIRNHGLLVMIKDGSDAAVQYSNDDKRWAYENPPRGAEEGDYFATSLGGDVYLRGSGLIRFLKRNGEWPRHWGAGSAMEREKYYRGRLGAMAISRGHEKSMALDKIKNASLNTVRSQLKAWESVS